MCRQYRFLFAKCGHAKTSDHWNHHCSHPGTCRIETVVTEWPQHCFQCLQKYQMPERQGNVYHRCPNPAKAAARFEQILSHHERHPDGPQSFDKAGIRYLSSVNGRLGAGDRSYLKQLEENLDAARWKEKEHVQDHRAMKDQRNLVLQLRYAHLTALPHKREVHRRSVEKITEADIQFRLQCSRRIKAFLKDVKDEELAEDGSECPICYPLLQNNASPGDAPVGLPCGLAFCLGCAMIWLYKDPGTCPTCRADFNLGRDATIDFVAIMTSVVNAATIDLVDPPTPWWIMILG